jgi:hypothetical protein
MAITVRVGAHTVKVDAPEGQTLQDLIVEVSKDVSVSSEVKATVEGNLVQPTDVIPDNSRVILTQPSGEKG